MYCQLGDYIYTTYHPLQEPESAVDFWGVLVVRWIFLFFVGFGVEHVQPYHGTNCTYIYLRFAYLQEPE